MRVFVENEKSRFFEYENTDSGNFIVFQKDECVIILQLDFKTSKTCSPSRIDLSDDKCLVYYLKSYLNTRPSLLCAHNHDFFFCNKRGLPFDSSASIAKYLGEIFQCKVSNSCQHDSPKAFNRHIFLENLDESKDVSMQKSLALLTKHSVRYQEQVYNDQTTDEIVKLAREVLHTKIAADVFGHRECDYSTEVSVVSGENDAECSGEEFDLKPKQEGIVALLDPISTADNIEFFLAKVA
jgi:hypothetical protein